MRVQVALHAGQLVLSVFNFSYSSAYELVSHCSFNCISLVAINITSSCVYWLFIYIFFCEESALCIFFLSYLSFPYWIIGVYIFWKQIFCFRYKYCDYLLLICHLPFHFFNVSCEKQVFKILIKTSFSCFFMIRIFCVLPNLCLPQGHKDTLWCFLPEVL